MNFVINIGGELRKHLQNFAQRFLPKMSTKEKYLELESAKEMLETEVRQQFSNYLTTYRERMQNCIRKETMDKSILDYAATVGRTRNVNRAEKSNIGVD